MNKYGVFVYDYDGNEELMDLRYTVDTQEEAERYAHVVESEDIPYLKGEGVLAYVEVYAVDENDERIGEAVYSSKEGVSQEEAERAHIGEENVEDFYEVEAGKKMTREEVENKIIECSELMDKGDMKALELAEKLQAWLDKKPAVKVEARDKNFLPENSEVICNECKLTWTGKGWKLAGATDSAKFLYNGEEVQFDFEGEPFIMGELVQPTKPLGEEVPEGAEGGTPPVTEGIPPAPSAPAPQAEEVSPAPAEG